MMMLMAMGTFDTGMIFAHAGLYLSVWQLYRQNRRNHDENVRRAKMSEYRQRLMWTDFCQRKQIDPEANGKDDDSSAADAG